MGHLIIKVLFVLIVFSTFSGCYYDVEEELYTTSECQTADMSYQNDILPIIQENCYVCHAANVNFGNITLEGHQNLTVQANNGFLVGAIRHNEGFSPMPQNNSQLLECEIEKIESWINDGAPNN
jgi:uncharacterized membrane protein